MRFDFEVGFADNSIKHTYETDRFLREALSTILSSKFLRKVSIPNQWIYFMYYRMSPCDSPNPKDSALLYGVPVSVVGKTSLELAQITEMIYDTFHASMEDDFQVTDFKHFRSVIGFNVKMYYKKYPILTMYGTREDYTKVVLAAATDEE
eukprot:7069211-Ditylum_brightwellii.AAC.1